MTSYRGRTQAGEPPQGAAPGSPGLNDGGVLPGAPKPLLIGAPSPTPLSGRRARRRTPDKVTIVDVARTAGVSVTTVSRVLRDHTDVHAETRALVRETIDRLGYRPSPIARALVSGQSRLLALFVSDITNPFYPQLAKSVEQEAARAGYMVVICNTGDRISETRRSITCLVNQGLDGVINASAGRDEAVLLSVLGDARQVLSQYDERLSRPCPRAGPRSGRLPQTLGGCCG